MPMWHIHIDAEEMTPQFKEHVFGMGFWVNDFLHEPGHDSWEPNTHLTYKSKSSVEFFDVFKTLEEYADGLAGLKGYIEGECIPNDEDIEYKPFDSSVRLPFKVSIKRLPSGQFKEDEIHVSLLRDQSDSRLLDALDAMGLYMGQLPTPKGIRRVYTMSGTRKQVYQLLPVLTRYLKEVGGGVDCSIKEERIAQKWTSSPDVKLPPVIDNIEWL